MNEEKKKVFPWKKVIIIAVIVLLVLAMTPLFWTNVILDNISAGILSPTHNRIYIDPSKYSDDKILISVKSDYSKEYEERAFTKQSFKWNNVDSIEYCDDYYGVEVSYIVVYLKKTGYAEVAKGLSRFRRLKFVQSEDVYRNGYLPNI